MNRKITLEQEKEIIELCKYKSQKDVGKLFKISQVAVFKIFQRNNIQKLKKGRLNMSKLPLDVDFFRNIDTYKKAYWLGYISADGNVKITNDKITLVSKDEETIKKFKNDIKSGHKISEKNTFDKRTKKTYKSFIIQIGNEIFTNNLIKNGITNKKSEIFLFPNINKNLYPYFIAGMFDGDGCISTYNKKINIRISLISTIETLIFIQNYILKIFNINKLTLQRVTKNKPNVWKMILYKDSINFLDFIYCDKEFNYLQRKYKIYLKYKNNL